MTTIYIEARALAALPIAIGGAVQAYIHREAGAGRVAFAPIGKALDSAPIGEPLDASLARLRERGAVAWAGHVGEWADVETVVQAEPSDERAAFEAWAIAEGFNTDRDGSEKYREYHKTTTRWAWMAWQACSRWASIQGARQ